MVSFKGAHVVKDIILSCVRWYVAYPLSYRQVEELMEERGVSVDHVTINCWVLKYSPPLEEASTAVSTRSGLAGAWTRLTSASKGSDVICIGRWMRRARRLIFS
jgi:transposase-like protein